MKTNKLTLEHLAPYLPYGLKTVNLNVGKLLDKPLISKMIPSNVLCFADGDTESKILLRPLSDLTKEIEVNGEKFVPMDFLYELFRETDLLYFDYSNVLKQPYNQVQKIFEWHFDVFGLIEKDLAIDINTIDNV